MPIPYKPETFDIDTSRLSDEIKNEIEDFYQREIDNISDQDIKKFLDDDGITINGINN